MNPYLSKRPKMAAGNNSEAAASYIYQQLKGRAEE